MNNKLMIAVLLVLSLVVSGCNLGGGKITPTVNKDDREEWVTGYVAFYNTNLFLDSAITIDDRLIYTDTGVFQADLTPGKSYDYQIQTLLGSHQGEQTYEGKETFRVEFPPFKGWSVALFDAVALHPVAQRTVRWPKGATLNVWIEPPSQDPVAQPRHVEMARNAFKEWEEILNGVISFNFVSSMQAADVLVEFKSEAEIGGYAGYCNRFWNQSTHLMTFAQIEIAHVSNNIPAIDRVGVYRHEIGHCIGLSHSNDNRHLMYPIVSPSNSGITEVEKNITRLLYSIPAGTFGFGTSSAQVSDVNDDFQSYYDMERNLMVDRMPISLSSR